MPFDKRFREAKLCEARHEFRLFRTGCRFVQLIDDISEAFTRKLFRRTDLLDESEKLGEAQAIGIKSCRGLDRQARREIGCVGYQVARSRRKSRRIVARDKRLQGNDAMKVTRLTIESDAAR